MGLYDFTSQNDRILSRLRAVEKGNLRLRRGAYGPVTGPFSRISNDFFDSVGNIDVTKSGVRKVGSVPPSANTNGFAYSSTATSITWYWDGTNSSHPIVIRRADGTIQVVPAGSLTVTGLVDATQYFFFPFWVPDNQCTIGWVPGTQGDPLIAFLEADLNDPAGGPAAAAQQNLQNREPLTGGAMTATTGMSGGAGGGGDHNGGGACVMSGTGIETLGNIPYTVEVIPEHSWQHLELEDGRMLNCTTNHRLFSPKFGKIPAEMVEQGDLLLTDTGERTVRLSTKLQRQCTKHKVIMDDGHLYYANGFLSHNVKPRGGVK